MSQPRPVDAVRRGFHFNFLGVLPVNFLDSLTRSTTAFDTWAEFREHLARGYVPTVYPTCRRKRLLIRVLKAHGFTVWPKPRKKLFFHGTPVGYVPSFD